jgi:hypothetical protein
MNASAPIDQPSAIAIAKRAASEHGHTWIEPSHVSEHGDEMHVSDNADVLGGNNLVVIDRLTGGIRKVSFYSR